MRKELCVKKLRVKNPRSPRMEDKVDNEFQRGKNACARDHFPEFTSRMFTTSDYLSIYLQCSERP